MNKSNSIAVIGGGFCGVMTVIQLIKQSEFPLNIILISKDGDNPKGIAYSTYNTKHVLNVPAGKMSVYPDEPEHFIDWIKSKPEYKDFVDDEIADTFMPRNIYGKYLEEIYNSVIKNIPDNINLVMINDEAIDINQTDTGAEIILKNNKPVKADKIVLALGNFIPGNPVIKDSSFFDSKKYFQNPWKKECVENLNSEDKVMIIGTGLTMVDKVLSLLDNGFTGMIYAVSTNGFFPLSHKKRKPYTDILEELHPPYDISKLYSIFRKHIKIVLSNGIPGEAVVDAVRPKTQEIWLSLSLEDKIKFMTHLRHLWGVARHRIPKNIYLKMQDLISKGRLEIIGGRIQEMKEISDMVYVVLKERKNQEIRELIVNRVINCTGPMTDVSKIDQLLVSNLYKKGFIVPDELKLGINALPDGTILQKDNSVSGFLFTIGSLLKGILWESTAVPELRVQAKNLAGELLNQLDFSSEVQNKQD